LQRSHNGKRPLQGCDAHSAQTSFMTLGARIGMEKNTITLY
jgi:hypothetical protein